MPSACRPLWKRDDFVTAGLCSPGRATFPRREHAMIACENLAQAHSTAPGWSSTLTMRHPANSRRAQDAPRLVRGLWRVLQASVSPSLFVLVGASSGAPFVNLCNSPWPFNCRPVEIGSVQTVCDPQRNSSGSSLPVCSNAEVHVAHDRLGGTRDGLAVFVRCDFLPGLASMAPLLHADPIGKSPRGAAQWSSNAKTARRKVVDTS